MFLGNAEWSKYTVVKWIWPWCVYVTLYCGSPQAYHMTEQPWEKAHSCFQDINKPIKRASIEIPRLLGCLTDSCRGMQVGVHGCICVCLEPTQRGVMLAVCRTDAGREGSRRAPAPPFEWQKEEEEEEADVVRRGVKKVPVFSQGLLTDTKSVFVCLPGCQIKEFLCVGGSGRVYLTLQLLLWSKCPTVNAAHESHLALDRGSLFSGERGSCLEKIFNGGGVWGVLSFFLEGGAWSVLYAVYRHIVGLCPLSQQ